MVAGALADENGVAQTVGDAGDSDLAVAIKQAVALFPGPADQSVRTWA